MHRRFAPQLTALRLRRRRGSRPRHWRDRTRGPSSTPPASHGVTGSPVCRRNAEGFIPSSPLSVSILAMWRCCSPSVLRSIPWVATTSGCTTCGNLSGSESLWMTLCHLCAGRALDGCPGRAAMGARSGPFSWRKHLRRSVAPTRRSAALSQALCSWPSRASASAYASGSATAAGGHSGATRCGRSSRSSQHQAHPPVASQARPPRSGRRLLASTVG
mmetsp:Transcript_70038/g.149936  ORF Transcript_70038/g.149936 Transcript_70038/m.149936 type:complete len:217 (+) Transcript_70038:593-1243(+)